MKLSSLPHILLLITDQFRHDVVSPTITPHLYGLEQTNGTTSFRRAYSSTPTCTPARAGLLTGKSPWAHGMLGYSKYTQCPKYPTTIPRVLHSLGGYETVAIGKNHFGPVKHVQGYQQESIYDGLTDYYDDYDQWFNESFPNMSPTATCGLEWNDWAACAYWFDEFVHPTAWTTRAAIDALDNYFLEDAVDDANPSGPLMLKVSYHRPHSPYDPPRRLLEPYLPGGIKSNVPQLDRFVNHSSWDRHYKDVPMTRSAWAGDPGAVKARHTRAGYLASVEFVDEQIGALLDHLKSRNVLDDFLLVWTSDHGDQNGDHYLWRKGYPWEGNAHIPMLMKLPHSSGTPPKVSSALVENRDIAPTLYDAIGVLSEVQTRDPLMNGKSLLPILRGQMFTVRNWLDLEHGIVYNQTIHWNALVGSSPSPSSMTQDCGYWKYIFHAYRGTEQLFCLETDPNETHDLVGVAKFDVILETWRRQMVHQFEQEGRGPHWVVNGTLQIRQSQTIYGTNFPCKNVVARVSSLST